MDAVFSTLEDWVLKWSSVPFMTKPADYSKYTVNPPSYWFVPPGVSAFDLLVTSAFTITLSVLLISYGRSQLWQVAIPATVDKAETASPKSLSSARNSMTLAGLWTARGTFLAGADYLLRFLCVVCACLTIHYKAASGRLIYLLQPCHMSNFLLMVLLFLPRRWTLSSRLFYFNNHCAFGTAMALLTPDLKALIMPGEVTYFFLQHWTLLLLPLVWMLRRRYPLYRATLRLTTLMWSLFSVLHWTVLFPFSIACNANINYMLMPPKVWPSSLPGHLYRPAILFACCPITFLFRGIIQLLVWLGGTYGDAAQEAADASKAAHLVDSMTSASTDDLPVTTTAAAEDGLRKRKGAVVGAENRVNTVDLPASPMQPPVSSRTRGKGAN